MKVLHKIWRIAIRILFFVFVFVPGFAIIGLAVYAVWTYYAGGLSWSDFWRIVGLYFEAQL